MTGVPLVLAPIVMALASVVERRLGPSAAGWFAALPVAFSVAVLSVSAEAGTSPAAAMALSAAVHVPAQVAFGAVFAGVLIRRGLLLGLVAGTVTYLGLSLVLTCVPAPVAVICAIPLLILAPSLMARGEPHPTSPRSRLTTALTCAGAAVIVAAAVTTTRLAGPTTAGAVAAFPTMSTLVAMTVARGDGPPASAHALTGLVRSLPCYLTFCLVVALVAPSAGLPAIALGLLACLFVARATWRAVPLAHQPASAP